MNQRTERLHELDSLRALAAIGVIGWHYTNHFGASPLSHVMAPFYRHGLLLVDFFFVLSGFVITRAYWNDRRNTTLIRNVRDRIARIFPLHFVTLCAVAMMQWVLVHHFNAAPFVYRLNDAYDFALHLVLLNRTGLERGFSFNAPAWSISTEFVVNLVFLAVIAMSKWNARIVLASIFIASLCIVVANGLISDAHVVWIDNDIFRTFLGFLAGSALSLADQRSPSQRERAQVAYDTLAIVSILIFIGYSAMGTLSTQGDLFVTLICFPTLIIGTIRGRWFKAVLNLSPLVFLGTISYSIYLVHYPIQLAIHIVAVATDTKMPYGSASFFLAFLVSVFVLATVTYRLIELPGKRLIRGAGNKPGSVASAAS